MDHNDLQWFTDRQPQALPMDPDAKARALLKLSTQISTQPAEQAWRRHGAARRIPLRFAVPTAAAVLAGGLGLMSYVVISADTPSAPAQHSPIALAGHPRATAHAHAARAALVRLADYVDDYPAPAGDATLVAQHNPPVSGGGTPGSWLYTLYADNGEVFDSTTEAGLRAQVHAGNNTDQNGIFNKDFAAAKQAATGDVQAAAEKMVSYIDLGQSTEQHQVLLQNDHPGSRFYPNWVWNAATSTLVAGSMQPEVRAGTLQMIATLPGVTITHGTYGGRPTLVLTAGLAEDGGSNQVLTINAHTGVPITFRINSDPGRYGVITYNASRVMLASFTGGPTTTTTTATTTTRGQ